jgi:hypothetical protein
MAAPARGHTICHQASDDLHPNGHTGDHTLPAVPASALVEAPAASGPALVEAPAVPARTLVEVPTAPRPAARPRILLFAALCAVCVAFAGGYVALAARRAGPQALPAPAAPASAQAIEAVRAAPHAVFRSTTLGETFGQVMIAPLGPLGEAGPRLATGLRCERVYTAAGQGLCLTADRGVLTTYAAVLFGPDLEPRHRLPLAGLPSRARLSPDGRYAAMTVFVTGDSYASPGAFSTRTTLVDAASGAVLGDLEQFAVTRDGERIHAPDFNFWGVTFARDGNRFYATLATGGRTYLVDGDVAARQMRVVREGVECPSLSPDNTRIAFKKQVGAGGRPHWRVAVLDLATMGETTLALETSSIDDQVEWLDDAHVLYGLPDQTTPPSPATSVWALPVDGSTPPRRLLANAWSPAVAR